jgi:AraC family transcriptional regulator
MTITYDIVERSVPAQYTAVVRGEMPADQLSTWLAETYQSVAGYLARAGIAPAGPPFARYTFLADAVAIEAGFPVGFEVPGESVVEPSVLPGGPVAVTTHMGRYEDLEHAYQAVLGWLRARGRVPTGPHWEVYFTDPNAEPDPTRWRTDVVVPYREG